MVEFEGITMREAREALAGSVAAIQTDRKGGYRVIVNETCYFHGKSLPVAFKVALALKR